jgi:hypothetical protein
MNEKEMIALIKALTRVIEKQNEYASELTRRFYNTERTISVLLFQLARLKGMKDAD